MDKEQLLQTVLACGATKATIIPQSQIVMSAHYRDICASNQCGGYGRCWMCPPEIGEIDELMEGPLLSLRHSLPVHFPDRGQL